MCAVIVNVEQEGILACTCRLQGTAAQQCQTTAACLAGAAWRPECPCACRGCLLLPWTHLRIPYADLQLHDLYAKEERGFPWDMGCVYINLGLFQRVPRRQ